MSQVKLLFSLSLILNAAFSYTALAQSGGLNPENSLRPAARDAVTPTSMLQTRAPRYQLRKSDSFDLEFALSPEFNQTVSVQPDGYITLKAVGTIYAEGLTIPELTERIQRAYAGTLHDPIITIELKDYDKPYFIASGQVGKPGKYDLRSDLTLTQAIAVAGGFTEASKHSQVVLFRPGVNGLTESRLINVKKMLKSRDLAEDVHLQPGDMIFVPQNRISKISRYLPTSSLGLYGNPTLY
jgi:polysaccharide export outer membrane protein